MMNKGKIAKRKAQKLSAEALALLRMQFPVSSGTQHRIIENAWTPPPQPPQEKTIEPKVLSRPVDPFKGSAPVKSQFGLKMLKKMGWSPGEGLGKNREGTKEPLIPDGSYAFQEGNTGRLSNSLAEELSGKHPVTALMELCTKCNWSPPHFMVVADAGPDHKKNFLMKVIVNGREFKPSEAAPSKKLAKANAAAAYLQSMGVFTKVPKQPL